MENHSYWDHVLFLVRLDWQDRFEFQEDTENSRAVLDNEVLIEVLDKEWFIVDKGSVHIVLADVRVPG